MTNLVITWLINRAKEPSTYAGLGVLLMQLGLHPSDPTVNALVQVLTASAGLLSVALKDKGVI